MGAHRAHKIVAHLSSTSARSYATAPAPRRRCTRAGG